MILTNFGSMIKDAHLKLLRISNGNFYAERQQGVVLQFHGGMQGFHEIKGIIRHLGKEET